MATDKYTLLTPARHAPGLVDRALHAAAPGLFILAVAGAVANLILAFAS